MYDLMELRPGKYLVLTDTPGCRALAESIRGSLCIVPRKDGQRYCSLHGTVSDRYYSVILGEGCVDCPMDKDGEPIEILFDLELVVVSPHSAMAYGTYLNISYPGIVNRDGRTIRSIENIANNTFIVDSSQDSWMMSSIGITLDLNKLPYGARVIDSCGLPLRYPLK